MKLSTWAGLAGVHPRTAYRWFHAGLLPVPAQQLATGTILVDPPVSAADAVALYARVSSADQRGDLDGQVARLAHDAAAAGLAPTRVVAEVGSALNGNRPKLRRLLADPDVGTVVAEHRDRLARIAGGYAHGPTAGLPAVPETLPAHGVRFTTGAIRVEADRHHVVHRHTGGGARPGHTRRLAPAGTAVGVDIGVADLVVAATAEGVEVLRIPAPKSLGTAQAPGALAQGPRQQPGSNRRRRTTRRIARVHARAANLRRDTLAKATMRLAQGCDTLVVEDLGVAGMGRRLRQPKAKAGAVRTHLSVRALRARHRP